MLYYSIFKSDECVPFGHTVNANIAIVTRVFSASGQTKKRLTVDWKGLSSSDSLLARCTDFASTSQWRTNLFKQFRETREKQLAKMPVEMAESLAGARGGIGTPNDMRGHLKKFEKVGVDQVTLCSAGRYEISTSTSESHWNSSPVQ